MQLQLILNWIRLREMDPEIVLSFKDCLRELGLKVTPERLAILEEIYSTPDHFEPDDLFLRLRQKKARVSRATVYRTLDLLAQNGFVSKVSVGPNQTQYENTLAQAHHEHLVCLECGKIIEFQDAEIERLQKAVCEEHSFRATKHNLIIFGLCSECRQ